MNYKTHQIGGLLAAEGVLLYYHQSLLSWEAIGGLFAGYFIAVVADIDKRGSLAGQQAAPISVGLSLFQVRHRTMTHSLLIVALLYSLLQAFHVPDVILWSAVLGYLSHPILDLFNVEGVEILWPITLRFKLLPGILAIPVDSPQEDVVRGALKVISSFLAIVLAYSVVKSWPYIGPLATNLVQRLPDFLQKFF